MDALGQEELTPNENLTHEIAPSKKPIAPHPENAGAFVPTDHSPARRRRQGRRAQSPGPVRDCGGSARRTGEGVRGLREEDRAGVEVTATDPGTHGPAHVANTSREIFSSDSSAGPEMTSPVGLKREPWHGQSQVCSAGFHATMHFKWVQTGEQRLTWPRASRWAATFFPSRLRIFPSFRLSSPSEEPCAPAIQSRSR